MKDTSGKAGFAHGAAVPSAQLAHPALPARQITGNRPETVSRLLPLCFKLQLVDAPANLQHAAATPAPAVPLRAEIPKPRFRYRQEFANLDYLCWRAVSSVGLECLLDMQEVTGSSPVRPTAIKAAT